MIKFCAVLFVLWTLYFPAWCDAQTQSASKLSAHLIGNYTAGSSNIISGRPGVLKVLGLDSGFPSGMVQAMRDYRARVPEGKIVVRIYSPKLYSLNDNATAAAADFWNTILQRGVNYLSLADRSLIDYLEGPNEGQTPTLGYPGTAPFQASQWFNQFWTNLTPQITAAGFRPCIGSIAVGNPGGTTAQMQSYLTAFVPALRQAQAASGAWSYHAYTINYTTDSGIELYYSIRYRQFYSYFAGAYPDLVSMPLILTEGGVDYSGDPSTSGWQARGSAGDYQRWLNWFDHQLQQDSYVLGCTLFENGDPSGWSSFELEPVAAWMKGYLSGPTAPPAAPTGVVARSGSGNIVISWTNVPVTPTTWTVKRSTAGGGPYTSIATNISTGVQATSFTDTAVTSGVLYYYVVSAVNAIGEGPDSIQASARSTNGLPDVVVTSASWAPATLFAGSRAVFSARVLNQGSAPTPAGTTLGVGFNVDGTGTASWAGSCTAALAPNASVLLTADGGPAGVNYWVATAGPHTLIANVDDINRFPEGNEANNILNVPMNVYATGYALNSGGPPVGIFSADSNFAGISSTVSSTNTIDLSGALVPAPGAVYQSARMGEFTYSLNYLPPGSNYTVRLHFAEISPSINDIGQRRFNVLVNGVQALTEFDVFNAAGGKFKALTRDIKMRADLAGAMTLRFSRGSSNDALCNGIQLFGSAPPSGEMIVSAYSEADGSITLKWLTSPGGIYQVFYTTDLALGAWAPAGVPMLASGSTLSFSVASSGAQKFYRTALIN